MKLVLVEWHDTFAQLHWHNIGDIDIAPMVSIGCLVYEDSNKIVLSSMFGREGASDYNCVQAIPKGCIKRMRQLKIKTLDIINW